MYKLNTRSLNLIKSFEGWRSKAYRCSAGVWTIGYGHTAAAGSPKPKPGMRITKAYGEQLLLKDMQKYARAVDEAIKVPLNANQFGALTSFCYNVGPGGFRKSSVCRYVNQRRFKEVPGRLMLWNKAAGKTLRGLTRRRRAEGKLFMSKGVAVPKATIPVVVTTTAVVALTWWEKIQLWFTGLFS